MHKVQATYMQDLPIGLALPPLALVRVQQQHQLLLYELPLLGVGGGGGSRRTHAPLLLLAHP